VVGFEIGERDDKSRRGSEDREVGDGKVSYPRQDRRRNTLDIR